MSDADRCHWDGLGNPRVLPARHDESCNDLGCAGCQVCPMDHCRVCGIKHSSGACGECLAEVRANIAEIGRLYAALPAEVETRGINGEAMNLLGPVSDPEAWGHVAASVASGRLPTDWQVELGRNHPLTCLVTWEDVYRDALEHETDRPVSVMAAATYLDDNLTAAGAFAWVPFEDFAGDLRACVAHLEAVLHDGEQVDKTRVTCVNLDCRRHPQLVRKYGHGNIADKWACPSCHKVYEAGEYRDAMARQLVHKGAEKYLPLRDAVSTLVAQGRPERTIRKWLAPPDPERDDLEGVVGGFCEIDSHRVWVWWPDLWRLHMTTKTRIRVGAAA
jgi:hypothetical protein